jgi:hypothetical protein
MNMTQVASMKLDMAAFSQNFNWQLQRIEVDNKVTNGVYQETIIVTKKDDEGLLNIVYINVDTAAQPTIFYDIVKEKHCVTSWIFFEKCTETEKKIVRAYTPVEIDNIKSSMRYFSYLEVKYEILGTKSDIKFMK